MSELGLRNLRVLLLHAEGGDMPSALPTLCADLPSTTHPP